jgi:predicted RNA binding protein YcfA (HicA-like mRNA interferase family)
MGEHLPQLKPQELIRVLEGLGFVFKRQTGSHKIYYHPEKKIVISVPDHARDIKRGLLFGFLRQLHLSVSEFIKYL